jgi:peptidoglycan/LPS O-acetylase OafA/YrhL
MVFNTFGDAFYVYSAPVEICSQFVVAVYPWWMTLLFVMAGISSTYALKKRNCNEYAKERVTKLLIPLLVGMVTLIPLQTYIADVYHNEYQGGFVKHYSIFFTKFTDLSGYDGGFTPAHTWFILYLFVISIITLPLMKWYQNRKKKIDGSKISMPMLLPMFLIILGMTPLLELGGKSVGESLACFLIGYLVLSLDEVQEMLMKYRKSLTMGWILLIAVRVIMYMNNMGSGIVWDIEQRMLTWIGILAILGLGKRHLNYTNKLTQYFSTAAFPMYLFHQTVLVIVAYYAVKITNSIPLQFAFILVNSFALTLLCYEIFRRFTFTSVIFGIKKKR